MQSHDTHHLHFLMACPLMKESWIQFKKLLVLRGILVKENGSQQIDLLMMLR